MKIYATAPLEDPRESRRIFRKPEEIGYDGGFSFAHWAEAVAQLKEKRVTTAKAVANQGKSTSLPVNSL